MRQGRFSIAMYAGLVAAAAGLTGCPGAAPNLAVTPAALAFESGQQIKTLTLQNTGGGALAWELDTVARAHPDAPWLPEDLPWLSANQTEGELRASTTQVQLSVDRTGLPFGTINNTGVRIRSNGGETIVPIAVTTAATLSASPSLFALSQGDTNRSVTLQNSGTAAAQWNIRFLPDLDDLGSAVPLPAGFTATPSSGTLGAGQSLSVLLNWPAAQDADFNLLVQSAAGSTPLRFRYGAALEGLTVLPSQLTLYVDTAAREGEGPQTVQPASKLRIRNTSGAQRTWTLELVDRSGAGAPAPITFSPQTGATAAGQQSVVDVAVSRPRDVRTGSGNYEFLVRSGEAFLPVPITVEILPFPEITLSSPPDFDLVNPPVQPISVLDFGRDDIQQTFYVVNTGARGSQLFFRVSHEDEDAERPLIVGVDPVEGNTNGPRNDFFRPEIGQFVEGAPIRVSVDRGNLREQVEFRTITVTAYDADFNNTLDVVAERTLQVRVERAPLTIEGQINRSRPPFLMRFVFLLRDSLGRAIPTRTQAEREDVSFAIFEEGRPLDLNETNFFVTGPDNLKVNLVLMLDFTGSMYFAGTQDPIDPLAPGEAVEQVTTAAKAFLDDLPAGYRVALMYYNDRQQQNRVIQQFTTDRASLKDALDAFTLPPALFGVSTIYDALENAIELLEAEDAEDVLPFDEADVRAVLFVTDGVDNASFASASDVIDAADNARVRLYPLAYAPLRTFADLGAMNELAAETGGRMYTANDVPALTRLLATEAALALEPAVTTAANAAAFNIRNLGDTPLAWTIAPDPAASWLSVQGPSSGVTVANGATRIILQTTPGAFPEGTVRSAVVGVNSASGAGTVRVRANWIQEGGQPAALLEIDLRDSDGLIWSELQNQLVLTYVTPSQTGGTYRIEARYQETPDRVVSGFFEEDGVFFSGDIRAGQLAMTTTGIIEDLETAVPEDRYRAEAFVRADYVPRNVNRFRVRFFLEAPGTAPAAAIAALDNIFVDVQLAQDGLLRSADDFSRNWRLIPEGDGVFLALTEEENFLPYGSFGNLFQITLTNLEDYVRAFDTVFEEPRLDLAMRADNQIYVAPGTPSTPSATRFFLYPGGPTNPGRNLRITTSSDLAPPARTIFDLAPDIDPEAPGAWDFDDDGVPDFNDPVIDDPRIPESIVVPAPLQIPAAQDSATLTVRNNRLDTFTWSLDPASLPDWIVEPGNAEPIPGGTLAPGEFTTFTLSVDRAGLPSGFSQALLVVNTDIFGDTEIQVSLVVP